jgi:hypothetical protein
MLDVLFREALANVEALNLPLADTRCPNHHLTIRKRATVDIRPAQALNVCL